MLILYRELDDELQDSLYDFLEVRGINDELVKYLHQYMKHKEKTEIIGWMEKVKSYIEKK
jgi:complement component 1 Q subcomponent-binding protein, mitochondrial